MRKFLLTTLVAVAGWVSTVSAQESGSMIVYEVGTTVPESEMVDLGPPEGLGGTVLEGSPRILARFDLLAEGVSAGVFESTNGKGLIVFPFTEHATILDGEVIVTDQQTGEVHRLRPGDSYFIRQGSVVVWDVQGEFVQKSFLNRREAADAPGPMRVYRAHDRVSEDELIDLGPPEAIGGTVIEGEPRVYGRIDFAVPPMLAGVFHGLRGKALIDFPFTEHATVMNGKVTLTDRVTGATRTLRAGDAYLIRQGGDILWTVGVDRVQKSFFNYAAP